MHTRAVELAEDAGGDSARSAWMATFVEQDRMMRIDSKVADSELRST